MTREQVPTRTHAEYTAVQNENQRLRAQLEQQGRELSNARIERDRLRVENESLRAQIEEDERDIKEQMANIKRIGERYGTRSEIAPEETEYA